MGAGRDGGPGQGLGVGPYGVGRTLARGGTQGRRANGGKAVPLRRFATPFRLAVPEKRCGQPRTLRFSTAAGIAASLDLPPAARSRNSPARGEAWAQEENDSVRSSG